MYSGKVKTGFPDWLAGFWEGEGDFYVPHGQQQHPHFEIYQSGKEGKLILEKIRFWMGCGNVYVRNRGGNIKRQYIWQVGSIPEIIKVVNFILPYLRFKRKSVEEKYQRLLEIDRRIKSRKRWLPEEEEYLKKNYKDMTAKEIATKLGKSVRSVIYKVSSLGLSKGSKGRAWIFAEDKKLRRLTDMGLSAQYIAKVLDRTTASVSHRRARLGLKSKFRSNRSFSFG